MATITNLRSRLHLYAKIGDTEEIEDNQIDQVLRDCLYRHNSLLNGNFSLLPVSHEEPLLILAWASVCYIRASKVAPEPDQNISRMTNVAFGQDRSSPFAKCIAMAKALEQRYKEIIKELGYTPPGSDTSASGGITVGSLRIKEDLVDLPTEIPSDQVIGPYLVVGTGIVEDSVVLSWSKSSDFYFGEYVLYQSNSSGIKQEWNWNSGSGTPGISNAAEKLISISDANQTSVKVEGLLADTTYFFLVVVKTTHAKYGYSNEVTVEVPA